MNRSLVLRFGLFLFILFMLFVLPVSAVTSDGKVVIKLSATDQAAVADLVKRLKEDTGNVVSEDGNIRVELKPNVLGEYQNRNILFSFSDKESIVFDPIAFENATDASRKEAIGIFVEYMQKSAVKEQTQQQIFDEISRQSPNVGRLMIPLVMDSTSADLYTALKWLKPILPIVRVIFGIGAILLTILLVGSTIIDLAFIGLPVARESMQNRADGRGLSKVPFVSSDALAVVKETESSLDSTGGYKNAYFLYFKRRILTYILLSICILYLVVGELGGLISWFMSLGEGVVF